MQISNVIYKHKIFQLIVAIRGSLVTAIYEKSLNLMDRAVEGSAAVSLMSTDVEGIATNMQSVHEVWASLIELGISIFLLQRQIGVVVMVTIGITICRLPQN